MPTRTNVVNTNVRVHESKDAEIAGEHMDTSWMSMCRQEEMWIALKTSRDFDGFLLKVRPEAKAGHASWHIIHQPSSVWRSSQSVNPLLC